MQYTALHNISAVGMAGKSEGEHGIQFKRKADYHGQSGAPEKHHASADPARFTDLIKKHSKKTIQ